jgi:hypothetical protein
MEHLSTNVWLNACQSLGIEEKYLMNTISKDDADAIVKTVLAHSRDFNGFLLERQTTRSAEAFDVLRNMVGKLMAAQYFEILRVVAKEYPDVMDRLDELQRQD